MRSGADGVCSTASKGRRVWVCWDVSIVLGNNQQACATSDCLAMQWQRSADIAKHAQHDRLRLLQSWCLHPSSHTRTVSWVATRAHAHTHEPNLLCTSCWNQDRVFVRSTNEQRQPHARGHRAWVPPPRKEPHIGEALTALARGARRRRGMGAMRVCGVLERIIKNFLSGAVGC
jgi:hypothetical protein